MKDKRGVFMTKDKRGDMDKKTKDKRGDNERQERR